jgi:nucleotide sugar dehydrogenase
MYKINSELAVIGLGVIGLPVAIHVSAQTNNNVIGYDISKEVMERAERNGVKTSKTFPKAETYIVAVNTRWGYSDNQPDMSPIEDVCQKISEINKDALVVLESTLAYGTTRRLSLEFGLKYLVACPHRLWPEDIKNHGVNQIRVIGAVNNTALADALALFKQLHIPVVPLPTVEYAEACKVIENTNRFMQIAFAQMTKQLADYNGLDFNILKEAVNSKWNMNVLEARGGIGGTCLPKDIRYLKLMFPDSALINGLLQSDEQYRRHIREAQNKTAPEIQVE